MVGAQKFIQITNIGGLRKLTITNPKKRNALNVDAYAELTDALNNAAVDNSVVVVALTGAGDYYSSGNDISAFLTVTNPQEMVAKSHNILREMIRSFYNFPKLLVCVVNGPCIGIAATTAALCDVIYAVDSAYFHTPFSMLALCAEGCASYTFPRILGKSKGNEMLMLNHKLSADEAYRFNFVSEVYKRSELDAILWPKIQEYARLPKESIRVTKKLINSFEVEQLQKSCDCELEELYKRFESDDFGVAVAEFMMRKSKL